MSGNGYLSFGAKCVSNPASCAVLRESDPLQPCDPAVLLSLLTFRTPHNFSQKGTGSLSDSGFLSTGVPQLYFLRQLADNKSLV